MGGALNSETAIPFVVSFALVALIVYAIFRAFANTFGGRGKVSASASMICPNCGTQAEPATRTKGSTLLELFLWLCLIVPGLIYSIWRVTSRDKVCPSCRQAGMIPIVSPRGRALVQANQSAGAAQKIATA